MSLSIRGFALILYGVDIKTASVSPQSLLPAAALAPQSPCAPREVLVWLWYACNDRLHLPGSLCRKAPSAGHKGPLCLSGHV